MSQRMREILQAILDLGVDGDGDVSFYGDEHGFNPLLHRIQTAMGVAKPLIIEVFPMDAEGGLAEDHDDVDHWDILLRPDGGDPYHEYEDLTREAADVIVADLVIRYPQATVNDDLNDLLH